MSIPSTLLSLLALPTLSAAWSWTFQNTPQQCKDLSIKISGSDGKPPYRLLILPFGPTPLANNVEIRLIMDIPFKDNSASVSFKLNYPANSQFVTIVSDATGFGSGGTSVAAQVTSSDDSSCFDPGKTVSPDFFFSLEPPNQFVQCQPMRLWWDKSKVQGNPNFLGIIPGGQSFAIPAGPVTDIQSQGTGFSWIPSLRGGTTLIIVGGDDRGNGTAGSTLGTVSNGPFNNGTCLNDASPSSTPGSPAGGSYPTSSTGGVGGGGSGSSSTGAIVGGVIGGIVFLLCLGILLFFWRRARRQKFGRQRPDLFHTDDGDDDEEGPQMAGRGSSASRQNDLPEYYQPEPFTVPDPMTAVTDDGRTSTPDGRPLSGYTATSGRTGTPDLLGYGFGVAGVGGTSTTSSGGRKGPLRQMRPVNVIQHDDAGPSEQHPLRDGEEPETVELPPAYTNIRQ